jgi:hypothetical protein
MLYLTSYQPIFMPRVLLRELANSGIECTLSVWAEGGLIERLGQVTANYLTGIYSSLVTHEMDWKLHFLRWMFPFKNS